MTPCGVSLKTICVSFCPLARVRGAFWLALPRGGQDCGTNPFLAATKLYRPGSTSLKRKYPALSVVVPYGTVFRWPSGCRVRYVFLRGSPLVALTTVPSIEHLSSGWTKGGGACCARGFLWAA